MITPDKMQRDADSITNIYSELEDRIFNIIIKALKTIALLKMLKKKTYYYGKLNSYLKWVCLTRKVINLWLVTQEGHKKHRTINQR